MKFMNFIFGWVKIKYKKKETQEKAQKKKKENQMMKRNGQLRPEMWRSKHLMIICVLRMSNGLATFLMWTAIILCESSLDFHSNQNYLADLLSMPKAMEHSFMANINFQISCKFIILWTSSWVPESKKIIQFVWPHFCRWLALFLSLSLSFFWAHGAFSHQDPVAMLALDTDEIKKEI